VPYAIVVFALGLVATGVSIRLLRNSGVVDVPNHRSSHTRPTVRGAGVGVAICGIGAAILAAAAGSAVLWTIAGLATAFAALGLADDLRPLAVGVRLPAQLLLAGAAVALIPLPGGWAVGLLALIFVVGYVNAFNFMDGINGISALHAAAIGVSWAFAGSLASEPLAVFLGGVVASAALAFLPFNVPRARAFLGDVGSYFFGGWIAISAMLLVGRLPLVVLMLPLLPYVADTGWTLLRRVRRGEAWHEAHREHVYQRVVQAGWSHLRASGVMAALTLICGALAVLAASAVGALAPVLVALAFVACGGYLALPTLVNERQVIDA
jgi:UDP-GlcNAc:undecaprenyl-phosphate/decaprenyl-phosphate GlcNAc-1-phosphate transferase